MDWAAVGRDIFAGLLIAGALAAWVPDSFWRSLFLEHHSTVAKFWGPLIGPAVAILSFVCSIGNVPLAAVLWNGGIRIGALAPLLFAGPPVLPSPSLHRPHSSRRVVAVTAVSFYS